MSSNTLQKQRRNDCLVKAYLSVADIANLDVCKKDGYGETCENLPQSMLDEILWNHGLDIKNYNCEFVVDTHRAFCTNAPMTCGRYVCVERTDNEWIKSGNASIDVQLQEADPEVRKQMLCSLNRDKKSKMILEASRGGKPKHKQYAKNIKKKGMGE